MADFIDSTVKPQLALNERDVLRARIRFLQTLVLGLLGLAAVQAAGWLFTAWTAKTVIVPADVRRPYELGSGTANRDYLAEMSNYVLQQILTVQPETVDHNNKVILRMTDPSGYSVLKSELDAAAQRIKKERLATVWVPASEAVSEADKWVRAKGRLKTYVGDVLTSEREKEYLVEFTITSSGRLYVLKAQEVVGPAGNDGPARSAS